jgi:hypothetical protein
MWGEGASDLWGHLEDEDGVGERELLEAVRARIARAVGPGVDDLDDAALTPPRPAPG